MQKENSFVEVFGVEIDGWCYGIEHYPGEVYPGLIFTIIRELESILREALKNDFAFDVIMMAENIAKAAKYLVSEKEIAFHILAQLPHPSTLSVDEQYTMAQVIDRVDQEYGGALERLKKKWSAQAEAEKKAAAFTKARALPNHVNPKEEAA